MPTSESPLTAREPVLVVTGVAAAIVAAVQAALPYLPDFGVPVKVITVLTTIVGLVGAGLVARARVISPATWERLTARPFPESPHEPAGPSI